MEYLAKLDNYIGLSEIGDIHSIRDRVRGLGNRAYDLAIELWGDLPSPTNRRSLHSYVGNSNLSGLPYPCSAFDCRRDALADVACFTAIYSDEVVLFNPLSYILGLLPKRKPKNFPEELVAELAFCVSQLLMLRPLIEKGMITFEDIRYFNYCESCFHKALSAVAEGQADSLSGDAKTYVWLMEYFFEHVEVVVERKVGREIHLRETGPSDILGHPTMYAVLERARSELKSLRVGDSLTRDQLILLRAGDSFAKYTSNDIVQSEMISDRYGIMTHVMSQNRIDLLTRYFGSELIGRSFDVEYPLLSNARLADVVSFRENEWHHLHDFRKLVETGLQTGESVADAIQDSSVRIEKLLRKNSRTLNRGLLKDAAIAVVGATSTLATAGLSGLIAAAIGAFSGGHLAKNAIPKLVERFLEPESIRDERAYFVWKVKQRLAR